MLIYQSQFALKVFGNSGIKKNLDRGLLAVFSSRGKHRQQNGRYSDRNPENHPKNRCIDIWEGPFIKVFVRENSNCPLVTRYDQIHEIWG